MGREAALEACTLESVHHTGDTHMVGQPSLMIYRFSAEFLVPMLLASSSCCAHAGILGS